MNSSEKTSLGCRNVIALRIQSQQRCSADASRGIFLPSRVDQVMVGLLTPVPVRRDPSTSEGDIMPRSFGIFLLLLIFSQAVLASPTGSIAGSVKDPTEAVVPGVKIT